MNIQPAQTSFAAGEISPLLYGQTDTPGYQSGLKTCLNMIVNPRGPVISRTGGRWIGREASGDDAKVYVFEVSYNEYYIVTVFGGRLTVNGPDEAIGAQFDDNTSPWTEAQVKDIQFVRHPSEEAVYLFHPNVQTKKLTKGSPWTLANLSYTAKPTEWTGSNWPTAGAFFQGRFYMGGTPNEPNRFWASKSGTDTNFTTGTADDDAIDFTIRDYGRIRWLAGVKNLLIGTENAELIGRAEAGVITPSDIQVDRQSAYGSYSLDAIQVGDQMFYVSPDRRKIRAMQYEWRADNWLSRDLTFFSEHITEGKIRDTAWAQDPDTLFLCVLDDGTMAIVSYDRSNDIWGWHRHSLVDGSYLSVSAGGNSGTSEVIVAIQRVSGSIDLEEWNPRETFYMDGWVSQSGTGLTQVTGLGHFEGETVQVDVDGSTHPDAVVSGGVVTLEYPGDVVAAGKGFSALIETLPLDKGATSGSGRPMTKRWSDISLLVYQSQYPLINGRRPPTRDPSMLMDNPPPLYSGLISVSDLGWDTDASIQIEQDLNQPLTVQALFGKVAQEIL